MKIRLPDRGRSQVKLIGVGFLENVQVRKDSNGYNSAKKLIPIKRRVFIQEPELRQNSPSIECQICP